MRAVVCPERMGSLLLLGLLLTGPSGPGTTEAERLAKKSILEYNVGDFDKALDDATEAYRLAPRPALLFNLGQCHRALHHWEKAEFFYRGYLREKPEAANRDQVEALIKEMVAKEQEGPTPAPGPTSVPLLLAPQPPPQAMPAPAPSPAPSPTVIQATPVPAAAVGTETPTAGVSQEAPKHSHALAYALAGVGVAGLVLTGVSTAEVLSYQSYYSSVSSGSQHPTLSSFQSQGSTANVFSALLFVGVGLVVAGAGGAVLTW
jgi:tetratricopeptide (TPR) repeat protein